MAYRTPGKVTRPRWRVIADGAQTPFLQVESLDFGTFPAHGAAVFSAPHVRFGGTIPGVIVGTRIRVDSDSGATIFAGRVRDIRRTSDAGADSLLITASSYLEDARRIFIGQNRLLLEASLRRGPTTPVSIARAIELIFGPATLDPEGPIRLGSRSALFSSRSNAEIPDLRFIAEPFVEALQRLLAFMPDLRCVERFVGDASFLDFVVAGDPENGMLTVQRPTLPEHAATRPVSAVTLRRSSEAAFNRCIGQAGPTRILARLVERQFGQPGTYGGILPAWDGASMYAFPGFGPEEDRPEATTLEQEVIDSGGFLGSQVALRAVGSDDHRGVLRRYRINSLLLDKFRADGEFQLDGNPPFGIQVLVPVRRWGETVSGVTTATATGLQWRQVPANFDAASGIIELSEPLVYEHQRSSAGSVYLRERAQVNVVLLFDGGPDAAIAEGEALQAAYDTGIRGTTFGSTQGRTFAFQNPALFDRYVHPAIFVDTLGQEVTQEWTAPDGTVVPEAQLAVPVATEIGTSGALLGVQGTVRPLLRELCEAALAERIRVPVEVDIELAYVSGLRPGQALRLQGFNVPQVLAVRRVSIDFAGMTTRVSADDAADVAVFLNVAPTMRWRDGVGFMGRQVIGDLFSNIGRMAGDFARNALQVIRGRGRGYRPAPVPPPTPPPTHIGRHRPDGGIEPASIPMEKRGKPSNLREVGISGRELYERLGQTLRSEENNFTSEARQAELDRRVREEREAERREQGIR
jgi:hypothetical protein